MVLVWPGRDRGLDHAENRAELAVINADEDRATGMLPSRFRPSLSYYREVAHIEGHQDALFVCRESEETFVAPTVEGATVEGAFLAGRPHVVTVCAQHRGDAAPRDMRVEEEPHAGHLPRHRYGVNAGELRMERLGPLTTLRDGGVDLLRKTIVVGKGKTDLPLGEVGLTDHSLDGVEILIGAHDLPNVQSSADDPGPALPIGATEGDTGEEASAERLIS